MKIKTWIAAVILACGVTGAQAAVVDFEDVTATSIVEPSFGPGGTLEFLDSRGFRFTSPDNGITNHAHLVSPLFLFADQSWANNGTQYIGLDPSIIVMTRIDGGAFSISRFDAAEGFLNFGSPVGFASKLRIEGSRIGGGTETATVDFDGLNDGTGPGVDFQTFALPSTFRNLSSVTFRSLNAAGNPDFVYFSLDNLQVAAVPEPAEWLLMVLGLGAVAACSRSKSQVRRSNGSGLLFVAPTSG